MSTDNFYFLLTFTAFSVKENGVGVYPSGRRPCHKLLRFVHQALGKIDDLSLIHILDRLNHVLNSEFGHVTYTEAIKLLEEHNDKFDYKVFWGCDLQTEHERYLTEEIFKKPVFVTDLSLIHIYLISQYRDLYWLKIHTSDKDYLV